MYCVSSLKFGGECRKALVEFPTFFYENKKPIRILFGDYPIYDDNEEKGMEWVFAQTFRNSRVKMCSDNPEKVANFIIEEVEKNKEAIKKYIKRLQNQLDRMNSMLKLEIEPFLNEKGYVVPTPKYDIRKMSMPYSKIFIGGTPVFENEGIICIEHISYDGKLKKGRISFSKNECKIMAFNDAVTFRKQLVKREKEKVENILKSLENSLSILNSYNFDALIEFTF